MNAVTLIFVLLMSFPAISSVKGEKVCSEKTSVCASYKAEGPFTTKQEGRFSLALTSTGVPAELVKVDLWMQMGHHGHGSSPLRVVPLAPARYDVTKAYFVMKGQWQIRVSYRQGNLEERLIIPVSIKE